MGVFLLNKITMNDNLHPIFQNILNRQLQLHDVMPHLNNDKRVNKETKESTKKCQLRFCDSDIIDDKWVKSCGECQHFGFIKQNEIEL